VNKTPSFKIEILLSTEVPRR